MDVNNQEMEKRTEALLYAAARRQHLVEKVIPALQTGKIVLCDRFIDSSLVYQGYARGIGIDEVYAMNQFAIEGCMPSLTLLFDVRPETGLKRIHANGDREVNRLDLESRVFHDKVYECYHMLQKESPDRIKCIDAEQPLEAVTAQAMQLVMNHIKKGGIVK